MSCAYVEVTRLSALCCVTSACVHIRLEILLNVKWTVKESTAQHSHYSINTSCNRDIEELVDREADLLNRGRSYKSMESLRARLSNLFLQFIENPAYNPRAEEFIHIPVPAPPSRT